MTWVDEVASRLKRGTTSFSPRTLPSSRIFDEDKLPAAIFLADKKGLQEVEGFNPCLVFLPSFSPWRRSAA